MVKKERGSRETCYPFSILSPNRLKMNALLFILLLTNEPRTVKTSIYNPVKSQCNRIDPTITASGTKINIYKLKQGKIRYLSVSRDLRKYFPYGTIVSISSCNAYYNGCWKVVDTLNKRFKNKIDFLQDINDKNKPPQKVIIR